MPNCDREGKTSYDGYAEAERIAKKIAARKVKKKYHSAPHVYKCKFCGKYHITGQAWKGRIRP